MCIGITVVLFTITICNAYIRLVVWIGFGSSFCFNFSHHTASVLVVHKKGNTLLEGFTKLTLQLSIEISIWYVLPAQFCAKLMSCYHNVSEIHIPFITSIVLYHGKPYKSKAPTGEYMIRTPDFRGCIDIIAPESSLETACARWRHRESYFQCQGGYERLALMIGRLKTLSDCGTRPLNQSR